MERLIAGPVVWRENWTMLHVCVLPGLRRDADLQRLVAQARKVIAEHPGDRTGRRPEPSYAAPPAGAAPIADTALQPAAYVAPEMS